MNNAPMKRSLNMGIFLFSLVASSLSATAFGSSADPIKIVSIKEVSVGPYKVGDVVTVEVEVIGGSPEIVFIDGIISNLPAGRFYPPIGAVRWAKDASPADWNPDFYNFSSTLENGSLHTVFRDSFIVRSNIFSGIYPLVSALEVRDATNLRASCPALSAKQTYFECPVIPKIQISGGRRIADGVVKSQKLIEKVELPDIPSIVNLTQPQIITLPRNTVSGTQLIWNKEGGSCQLKGRRFPNDSTNTLVIDRVGVCSLFGGTLGDDGFEKYSFHQMISVKSAQNSISCVKGKMIKKIIGLNPKCPPGYIKK